MTTQLPGEIQQLIDSLLGAEGRYYTSLIDIRPETTFRFNPLKHSLAFQEELLAGQGYEWTALDSISAGSRLRAQKTPIGRSLSHFIGHLYIQDLASMVPVAALNPNPGDKVLDLCAAPGSKTTQLACAMGNEGLIVANDVSAKRLRSLVFNLRRMGVANTAVCKGFGEQYGNLHFEYFDKVLLDPPCSALGTLQKSPEVASWWTPARSEKLAVVQLRLLESGLKALKPGGVLTYSTCTITSKENEQVLDSVLDRLPVEIEEIAIQNLKVRPGLTRHGSQRFNKDLAKAIRLYPWENQSEGFFVARLRKTGSFGSRKSASGQQEMATLNDEDSIVRPLVESMAAHYGIPVELLDRTHCSLQQDLYCASHSFQGFPFAPLLVKVGLPVAHIRGDQVNITTEGAHLLGSDACRNTVELPHLESMERYVNREDLSSPVPDTHQVLVRYQGFPLGHAVSSRGQLLSRFPRSGWRFDLRQTLVGK